MKISGGSYLSGRGKLIVIALLLLGAVGGGGYAYKKYARRRSSVAEIPKFDPKRMDPAVVRSLQEKSDAVRHAPSAKTWGELGMVFMAHGHTKQGIDCFRNAERFQPTDPRWPYLEGICMGSKAAIPKFQRAVTLGGNSPDVLRLRLAETLVKADEPQSAAKEFEKVLQFDPKNARAHLGLARIAHGRGDYDESLKHLEYCTNDVRTQKAAGQLLLQIHRLRHDELAAADISRQIQKMGKDVDWPDPFVEEVLNHETGVKNAINRAQSLMQNDEIEEAVELLKKAIEEHPHSLPALFLLGRAYTDQGEYAAAEEVLKSAVKLDPDSSGTYFRLGVAQSRQRRYEEAAKSFRLAVEKQPDFSAAYYQLALCLLNIQDLPGANEAIRGAIHANANFADAHRVLGSILADEGKIEEAMVELQTALKLDPDNRQAKERLEGLKDRPQ